jgi:hypothetical protein
MRLSLSILPLLFAPLVAAYATHPAPRNLTARAHSTHLDARAKASSCAGLYTRNQVTCACNPGLIDPGKPKKECTCPDYPNTEVLITEVIYDDSTGTISFGSSCICLGAGQGGSAGCPLLARSVPALMSLAQCTTPLKTFASAR